MTVADLRSIASDLQIPGRSKATRKADLVSLILVFQEEASVVEPEPTPVPVNTDDDGSDGLEDPGDQQRTGSNRPGLTIHVSLGQIYHPRPPLKTPPTLELGRGNLTWGISQKHLALPGVPVRGPP